MNMFKYNTILLLVMFSILINVSFSHAVVSDPTLGPSVGYRPTFTGGLQVAGGGFLEQSPLIVGETIALWRMGGNDQDGDNIDTSGAYCIWYKVDPITDAAVVVQDRGDTDRNCSYKIRTSDLGFKIKNTITIFSNQNDAILKGYTINPIDSWPQDTVSSRVVEGKPFTHITVPGSNNLAPIRAFPENAYEGVVYRLFLDRPRSFNWSSSDPTIVSVDLDGNVRINARPGNNGVTISAVSTNNEEVFIHHIRPSLWFIHGPDISSHLDAKRYCEAQGDSFKLASYFTEFTPLYREYLGQLKKHPWNGVIYHDYNGGGFGMNASTGNSTVSPIRPVGTMCVTKF
ncbi:Ig-like domain-containing protein [Yersinia ruckeri]|uniref:Ig-like domain-containing protein n=1 Tax=Yersinia ruckeri TaxID=29486 RepID=UPI0022370F75|nr:Ig-like domain-containing protein [Yersinia ruckeri]MCW6569461.1 Ig-like domain-containing protein [Yersinia ruckeri]